MLRSLAWVVTEMTGLGVRMDAGTRAEIGIEQI